MRRLLSAGASDNDPSSHHEPTEEEQTVGSIVAVVFSIITVFLVLAVVFGPMMSPYDWWYTDTTDVSTRYVRVLQVVPGRPLKGAMVEMPTLPLYVPPPPAPPREDEAEESRRP